MNMRTPLAKVRGLGAAREGTRHFWRQRLTAIANIPLSLIAVWLILGVAGESRETVAAALSRPFVAVCMLALCVSVPMHMRLGMQVIIEDYVHGEFAKIALLVLNTLFCAAVGLLGAVAILKLALGG